MQNKELFLTQLDRESAITRRMLERVPEGRPNWKPHEKSMALGYLSTLVATMPSWIESMVAHDELSLGSKEAVKYSPASLTTNEQLLGALEDATVRGRLALTETTDEHLTTTWRLIAGGRVVSERPRHIAIFETFTHWAHHRGQLSVYLRLNDVPLASIYGPTADEKAF